MKIWELKILFVAALALLAAIVGSFDTFRYQFFAERVKATVTRCEEIEHVMDADTGRIQRFLDIDLSYVSSDGVDVVENRVFPLWHGYESGDVLDYRHFPDVPASGRVFGSLTIVWPTLFFLGAAFVVGVAVVFGREANRPFPQQRARSRFAA